MVRCFWFWFFRFFFQLANRYESKPGYYGAKCDTPCRAQCTSCDQVNIIARQHLFRVVQFYFRLGLWDLRRLVCFVVFSVLPSRLNSYSVPGYFGLNCVTMCSTNCGSGGCGKNSGACVDCRVGYFGANCATSCAANCTIGCDKNSGNCLIPTTTTTTTTTKTTTTTATPATTTTSSTTKNPTTITSAGATNSGTQQQPQQSTTSSTVPQTAILSSSTTPATTPPIQQQYFSSSSSSLTNIQTPTTSTLTSSSSSSSSSSPFESPLTTTDNSTTTFTVEDFIPISSMATSNIASGGGLPIGAIIGIGKKQRTIFLYITSKQQTVIGVLCLVLLVVVVVVFLVRKNKRDRDQDVSLTPQQIG